jgi:hypothetical protein
VSLGLLCDSRAQRMRGHKMHLRGRKGEKEVLRKKERTARKL